MSLRSIPNLASSSSRLLLNTSKSTLTLVRHTPSYNANANARTLTSSAMSFSSVRLPAPKKGPPAKKMVHLQSINAIPSLYPEFRNVLWTGESSQLVVMTVPVDGDIGEEVSAVWYHWTSPILLRSGCEEYRDVESRDDRRSMDIQIAWIESLVKAINALPQDHGGGLPSPRTEGMPWR
jgi:hypothetical protein